jgi:hypothetical protein
MLLLPRSVAVRCTRDVLVVRRAHACKLLLAHGGCTAAGLARVRCAAADACATLLGTGASRGVHGAQPDDVGRGEPAGRAGRGGGVSQPKPDGAWRVRGRGAAAVRRGAGDERRRRARCLQLVDGRCCMEEQRARRHCRTRGPNQGAGACARPVASRGEEAGERWRRGRSLLWSWRSRASLNTCQLLLRAWLLAQTHAQMVPLG